MLNIKIFRLICAGLFALVLVSVVYADNGFLPGGTAVSITLDTPLDGAEFTAVEGKATIPVSGIASVGNGVSNADTSLIFLLDISGSTEETVGSSLFCPDKNPIDVDPGDPIPDENEIIDCEIGAAIALNEQAAALGTIDEVAVVVFAGDAVAADTTPDGAFTPFTAPLADQDGNGYADIAEVLQSIQVAFLFGQNSGFGLFQQRNTPDIVKTDYADALRRAEDVAATATNENVIIVMVSDGINNAGSDVSDVLPLSVAGKNISIQSFVFPDAYGFGGDCTIDWDGRGSLQDVADLQNGAAAIANSDCHSVSDPATLPDVLPNIILPKITNLSLRLNNGADIPFSTSELSLPLPQDGPIDVAFATNLPDLPVGTYHICATMDGTDAGGNGRISDCATVTVIAPLIIPEIIGRTCDERNLPFVHVDGVGLQNVPLPQTMAIDDTAVRHTITQATMKAEVRVPMPDWVYLSADGQASWMSEPTHADGGFVYEARFEPTTQVAVTASGEQYEPLSLVNYMLLRDESLTAQSVTFVNTFVNRAAFEQTTQIETAKTARDLLVQVVLSDIDDDAREAGLTIQAGEVVETAVVTTPNKGSGLAIYETTLTDVAGDIDRVFVTLDSPRKNGDSVFWNSTLVTYPCDPPEIEETPLPATFELYIPVAAK